MNKALRIAITGCLSMFLFVTAYAGGFATRHFLPVEEFLPEPEFTVIPVPTVPEEANVATPDDLEQLYEPFWQTRELVHQYYVDQPVDDELLMRGAIRGMLEALGDEHTSYMDPQEFKDANDSLAGEYEGIGAYVDTSTDYLTIISPMPGSPAEIAGIKPGDQVIAIDGEDMTGIDGELVRLKVLGPAGSKVTLTVLRDGESEPVDIVVMRDVITIKNVTGEILDNDIAYIQLASFGDTTTQELRATLKELLSQNPRGLILDLRNNGGGYLITAIEVSSQFIDDGVILYEQYGDGTRTDYNALGRGMATEIPMVVLINSFSASASEIVAGAIQDYDRGLLVGETSYGKGSVQNWIPLPNDQGAARITIAKWVTPNGRAINGEGLTPDVAVEITEEDFLAGEDPQLDRAIEVLFEAIGETVTD
ncbi:MAG: S41 family peptidase [Anaerolineales bacterium]|nr:S41 family peptidase [Anaerolineales bacterium]